MKAAADRRHAKAKAVARIGEVVPIDAAAALEEAIARLYAGVIALGETAEGGDAEATDDYRRWLVDLGRLAKDTHAAGIDERRLALEASKAQAIAAALDEAVSAAGLTEDQREDLRRTFGAAVRRRLGSPGGPS